MRSEDFREAVTGISEEYIVDALENEIYAPKKKAVRARILVLSFAAALLAAALALTLVFALKPGEEEPPVTVIPTETATSQTTPAPDRTPAATVCLDAGVGITMTVSENGEVLDIEVPDERARAIVKARKCVGMRADKASSVIVSALVEEGFLSSENSALILSVNGEQALAYTLTEEIEKALDVVFISILPGGKLILQVNCAGDGRNAKEIAATAECYGISYAKAELVTRLTDVVPEMSEKTLARLSVSELRDLCEKYGVPTESEIKAVESQAIKAVRSALGESAEMRVYNCEFCCFRDLDTPAWYICVSVGSVRRLYFVDATSGKIVWEKVIDGALTKEDAKELALLRFAIGRYTVERSTASVKDGLCTLRIYAMNYATLERERYTVSVDLGTGVALLMDKTVQK